MSSLAQEESRSISENVTWGQRKRFADGKVSLPYKHFLGYKKGDDGFPEIVESEAKVIRTIYKLFLEGKTISYIANYLTKSGIKTPGGKDKWTTTTVRSILTNEKYKGDALLQKCYTVDFLTKKRKKNEGEVPQYYVKNSHEGIISPEVYDLTQVELKNRKMSSRTFSSARPFSSKIQCGECGHFYGSKVWHSTSKYRRVVWRCNNKYKDKEKCKTPHLYEEKIKEEFIKAFNNLVSNKDEVIRDCEEMILSIMDTKSLDSEIEKLREECDVIAGLTKSLINENARKAMDQYKYKQKYDFYIKRYDEIKNKLFRAEGKKQDLIDRKDKIQSFIGSLRAADRVLSEFDESIWSVMVEKVVVNVDGSLNFKFKY